MFWLEESLEKAVNQGILSFETKQRLIIFLQKEEKRFFLSKFFLTWLDRISLLTGLILLIVAIIKLLDVVK